MRYGKLTNRAFIRIKGKDTQNFLQALITNDITTIAQDQAIYTCLLTPQGKYLFDFFIWQESEDSYLIDALNVDQDSLYKKLTLYKLRSQVELHKVMPDEEKLWVGFCWDKQTDLEYLFQSKDLRHGAIGYRYILNDAQGKNWPAGDQTYIDACISYGLPQTHIDLIQEKTLPHEACLDVLGTISFKKGCYVGQELVSRIHYRALLKKKNYILNNPNHVIVKTNAVGSISSHQDSAIILMPIEQAQEIINNQEGYFLHEGQKCHLKEIKSQ